MPNNNNRDNSVDFSVFELSSLDVIIYLFMDFFLLENIFHGTFPWHRKVAWKKFTFFLHNYIKAGMSALNMFNVK